MKQQWAAGYPLPLECIYQNSVAVEVGWFCQFLVGDANDTNNENDNFSSCYVEK